MFCKLIEQVYVNILYICVGLYSPTPGRAVSFMASTLGPFSFRKRGGVL